MLNLKGGRNIETDTFGQGFTQATQESLRNGGDSSGSPKKIKQMKSFKTQHIEMNSMQTEIFEQIEPLLKLRRPATYA